MNRTRPVIVFARLPFRAVLLPMLCLALALAGCGNVKSRDEKIVTVHEQASQLAPASSLDGALAQLKSLLELYFPDGRATRQGVNFIFAKFRAEIAQFLAGTPFTPDQLIQMLFSFDRNGDGAIDLEGELSTGVAQRFPMLRWIRSNDLRVTPDELGAAVARDFPQATPVALKGLQDALARFDEIWAGGNGDGLLTRGELSGAGLVLGVLNQTDFTKAFTLPIGAPADQKLVIEQLQKKLSAQLYRRHQAAESAKLGIQDLKLEWMQLSMRFLLCDKLAQHFGVQGLLEGDRLNDALAAHGYREAARWTKLFALYDNKLLGGSGDGKYDGIELFNLVTELDYSDRVLSAFGQNLSYENVTAKVEDRKALFSSLLVLFPRAGQGIFMGDRDAWRKDKWAARDNYWNGELRKFGAAERGGYDDGRIDTGELTMALTYARFADGLYDQYDIDHDTIMTKSEARPLFEKVGMTDSRILDAFFADIGLDGDQDSFLTKLKMLFSGKTRIDKLLPYDFHLRLAKVLPRILNK